MSFFEFPNTRTYDNDLGWLIKNVKNSDEAIKALEDWKAVADITITELRDLLDALASGTVPEEVATAITKWLSINAKDIVGAMIKNVWFGLTMSGYFVAYIPDSWNDIIFKTTGYDFFTDLQENYGHLVLLSRGGN